MDAMQLLRSYRDDAPAPDDARLRAMRARLEHRMAAVAAPRRRPLGRPIALAALGAATTVGVVAAIVTAGPVPQASAEASRLLDAASASARGQAPTGAFRTIVL